MPETRSTGGRKGQDWFVCLALLGLTLAVYWPVSRFDFVNYDDGEYVSENLRVQAGLTAENAAWALRTFFFQNWHPLTWLSYMLDCQLFGLNPGAFHLVNLLFHVLTTLLLFAVLKRMTGARWPSALVAALFAVHPLHVESVAWIAERKDVLSGFFGMLTLWAYVKWVGGSNQYSVISNQSSRAVAPREGGNQRSPWYYWLAVGFFALGLMAKPMLVTLPFVLLLLDYWPLCRLRGETVPDHRLGPAEEGAPRTPPIRLLTEAATIGRLLLEKVPFFVLTVLSSVVTYMAQQGARVTALSLPVPRRMANALVSYGRYLSKTIWPENLAVYYPYPGPWAVWQVAGAALLLLAVTVLVLRLWRKRPYLTVGWLWFLGTLVPVIGLVQVGGQSMADRYMYLPMVGLLIMLAWGAAELAGHWRIKKAGLMLAGGGVVVVCLVLSSLQVRLWANSLRLFEHALVATGGSTVAHNLLGDALLAQGKTNEALAHFSAAKAIDPEDFWAYGNFGNVFFGQGKTEEAQAQYEKGLKLNSKNPELNHNMGLCLARQGKFAEAVGYYSAALKVRTEYADAYLNLGNALAALGKLDEAITNYTIVLRLRPNFAPAHFNLGNALTQQGKFAEAAPHYAEMLRVQPNNAQAHANLALGLAQEGKNRPAIAHLTEALRLKPDEAQFHYQLAMVLHGENRFEEAIAQYREALRLKPDSVLALNNLAWILATHPEAKFRDGPEAVKHAERACELTGRQQSFLLGTLAAAYAEAGRFPEAIATAQKAIDTATAAGQKEIAATNQELIESYRAGRPHRESP